MLFDGESNSLCWKKLSRKTLILHPLKILNLSRREAVIQAGILAWA